MAPNPHISRPVLLLLLPAAFCVATAESIHVPISLGHRESPTIEERGRYGLNLPIQRRVTVPIGDESDNAFYYLTLSIGTPAQQFHFEVDLGSPYSWVADISCTIGCTSSMELYNPSLSSTATQISTGYSINYTSGSVSGNLVTDTVRLGAYTVPSQFFFTANHLSGYIVGGTSSGVVGLTYQQTADGPSFPMSLFLDSKGQLASAEMSFWVNRLSTSIDDEENPVGGAFTYGGTNTSFYQGEIDFLPTTGSSSWKLNVQEIIIQGKSVQITSGASALAGFSLSGPSISGPASDVAAIWAAFPAAVPSTTHSGYYQFPCSTTVSVSISFGGRLWPINPVDMNLGLVAAGSSQCLGAIYTPNLGSNKINTDGRANWIFGTAFMRNVYSVFQPNPFSIGFAKLSIPAQTGVFPPSGSASKRSVPRGAIVGGVVGGVVVVVLFVVCNVRRRKAAQVDSESKPTPVPGPAVDLGSQTVQTNEAPSPSRPNVPQVEYVLPSTVSSVPVQVAHQPQPQSPTRTVLFTMKAEQTSAAHHYGATYTASDVLVRNSDGLQQLSPRVERPDRSYSSWSSPTHAADGIQEVHRGLNSSTSPAGITRDSAHDEDVDSAADLGAPPRYQENV